MFRLFKKKKKSISEMSISEAIIECIKKGAQNLHINLYIEDQILFQVMGAKHFKGKGLEMTNADDMAIVHMFDKKKTFALMTWENFKSEELGNKYVQNEELKGIYTYVKNIGNKPKDIEQIIQNEILLYEAIEKSKISFEYVDY